MVVVEEGEGAAVVEEVAEAAERGWEAAGCRGLRHRWVDRRRLAVGRDQVVACRGPREARRDPQAESAAVALVQAESAQVVLVLAESAQVALVLAELAGPAHWAGRRLQALHRDHDRGQLILAAVGRAASAALVLD
jgi:hypothetical protein